MTSRNFENGFKFYIYDLFYICYIYDQPSRTYSSRDIKFSISELIVLCARRSSGWHSYMGRKADGILITACRKAPCIRTHHCALRLSHIRFDLFRCHWANFCMYFGNKTWLVLYMYVFRCLPNCQNVRFRSSTKAQGFEIFLKNSLKGRIPEAKQVYELYRHAVSKHTATNTL